MLRSIKDLIGYTVDALDGRAGKVADFLLHDKTWEVRYLVTDKGQDFHINLHYLSEADREPKPRMVLVPPDFLSMPRIGWNRRHFPVLLTKEGIDLCPSLASKPPVSLCYQREYTRYLRHAPYDERPEVFRSSSSKPYTPPNSAYDHSPEEIEAHKRRIREISRIHLRSSLEIMSYRLAEIDGEFGNVEDLILDDRSWHILYLVANTGSWPHSRKSLVDIRLAREIDWSKRLVELSVTRRQLDAAPSYHARSPVNSGAHHRFYDYLGKSSHPSRKAGV